MSGISKEPKSVSKGFGGIPKPNIITPAMGRPKNPNVERFLMMYTCKLCEGRNAQMVSKIAYYKGMVVSTCKQCKNLHLIADNEKQLDYPEFHQFGQKVEDLLKAKGETVQRLSVSLDELEDNYLIDKDGELSVVPKAAGQPDTGVNVIDLVNIKIPSAGK